MDREVFRERAFKDGDHDCIIIKTRGYGTIIEVAAEQLGMSFSQYLTEEQAQALHKSLGAAIAAQ